MSKLPRRYPRRTVRIDVSTLRRNAGAISERARVDKLVILRCGKPTWIIVHEAYFTMLRAIANQRR